MMHQINLLMARLRGIPGNALHGNRFAHLIGSLWPFVWQAVLARAVLAQQTRDGRFADLPSVLLYLIGQVDTPEACQVLCRRK